MMTMPSIFSASQAESRVKSHQWDWEHIEVRSPKALRSPLVKLIRRTPELEKSFDWRTGLPIISIGVEIDKVMEVNAEEDFVVIRYELRISWLDLLENSEYNKTNPTRSSYVPNYYRDHYPFNPDFMLHNVMDTDEELSDKCPQFKGRYPCGDYTLVHLEKTRRAVTKIKQPGFDLMLFPLDRHEMELEFIPMRLDTSADAKTYFKKQLGKWKLGEISTTHSMGLFPEFSAQPLCVKHLKTYERQVCRVSGLQTLTDTYPFMSWVDAEYKDFWFDTHVRHEMSDDRYKVVAQFYRNSNSFVLQNLVPVLLTVIMTIFCEWIPPEDVADRLSVLVTLFLALYTHKGVVVAQISTMQTTSIEWVMIFGYFCMFFQACVIVLASPSSSVEGKIDRGIDYDDEDEGEGGSKPWVLGPRDAWVLQLTFLGLMVLVLFFYFLRARLHASYVKQIQKRNRTTIPAWLYEHAPPKSRAALRGIDQYHRVVSQISAHESEGIKATLSRALKTRAFIPQDECDVSFDDLNSDPHARQKLDQFVNDLMPEDRQCWKRRFAITLDGDCLIDEQRIRSTAAAWSAYTSVGPTTLAIADPLTASDHNGAPLFSNGPSLEGKIVLIERGEEGCSLFQRAADAHRAGAVGVIFVANPLDDLLEIDEKANGEASVAVPVLMMPYTQGKSLENRVNKQNDARVALEGQCHSCVLGPPALTDPPFILLFPILQRRMDRADEGSS